MTETREEIYDRMQTEFYNMAREIAAVEAGQIMSEAKLLREEVIRLKDKVRVLEAENYQLKMSQCESVWKQRAEMLYEEVVRLRREAIPSKPGGMMAAVVEDARVVNEGAVC